MNKRTLLSILLLFAAITMQAQELEPFVDLKTYKYGYKNAAGKVIVPAKYDYATSFAGGLAQVSSNKKTGCIDKTGKEVIPLHYDLLLGDFSEGTAIYLLNNKYGILNKNGERQTPPLYEYAVKFSEGLAMVKKTENGHIIIIDKTGATVLTTKYTRAKPFTQGLAAVSNTDSPLAIGNWGFIDKTGKEIIPLKYESLEPFSDNLAAAAITDWDTFEQKWGYIDRQGKTVVPFLYEMPASEFFNGKARVRLGGRTFYIDKTGKEVK